MRNAETVRRVLGGKRVIGRLPHSDLDFVEMVRQGLPYQAVLSAGQWLRLTEDRTVTWLGIPKRTAARRKATRGRLRSAESERLLRLARVAAMAADVLGTREKAVQWMERPNRALGGEVPVRLLDTDLGSQKVLDVLGRIEHGVVS